MASYQKIIFIGNLTKDPEMKYTSSGQAVTNFRIAVNNTWVDQNGEVQEETMWVNVSVWGKQAETCNQYLSKGREVLVEGKLGFDKATGNPRMWDDQTGKTHSCFDLKAFEVKFLGGGRNGSASSGSSAGSSSHADVEELTEDEIPF